VLKATSATTADWEEEADGTITLTNADGGTITQGQPVYINGNGTVGLATPFSTLAKARFFGGVVDASIGNGASGKIRHSGVLTVPSAAQSGTWLANDKIYLYSSGFMTNAALVSFGAFIVSTGTCINTPGGGNALVLLRVSEAEVVL
jgi:hypothetical protein